MGEFNDTVLMLLEAFSSGLDIVKAVRQRRRDSTKKVSTGLKTEELRLARSLKRSKLDVSIAYSRDLSKAGSKFGDGDVEAHSALITILIRLNAGFVGIIDKFRRGKSTRADYQSLGDLSITSRKDAIRAFSQLYSRISTLSQVQKSGRNRISSSTVKPKGSRSSASKKGASSGPQRSKSPTTSNQMQSVLENSRAPSTTAKNSVALLKPFEIVLPSSSQQQDVNTAQLVNSRPKTDKRASIVTFSSGSTKLGEIPSHRWVAEPSDTAYPATPWQAPSKPKSRFMRIFRM